MTRGTCKQKKKDQKVRCKWKSEVPCRAPPEQISKNHANETIVANGNHKYLQDPMNKVYQGQKHLLTHH